MKRVSHAGNAEFVIEWLNEHEFSVPPGCRLLQMRDQLGRGPLDYGTPEFWVALQSYRDLVEIGFAFEQLGDLVRSPKFEGFIDRLFQDKALPQQSDPTKNTPGRDTQWELYLAAICQSAGMKPVGLAGDDVGRSDVTCTIDGVSFGIEAKRIKGEKSARDRIKDGIDQILEANRPGVVAVDMSLAWNSENRPIVGSIHNAFLNMILDDQTSKFFDRHKASVEKRGGGKGGYWELSFSISSHA